LGDSRHPLYVLIVSLSLANCYFAQDSSRFPVLFFHPFHRHLGSVARSWRRPFPSRGVPSPQAPTLDRESLPTILQSLRVGPHSCRLDGTLGATNSSATFRNCTEAFDTASLHKAMGKRKYCMLFFPNRHRKPGPKGPSAELVHAVVEMKQRNPNWGLSANRTTDRLGVPHPTRQRRGSQDSRPSLPASTGLRWSRLADFPGPHERQPLEHGSIQVRVRHAADPLGPGGHVLDGCRS
jgi:hypothetical protein